MLRCFWIGPCEADAPPGVARIGGPDLLASEQPAVIAGHRLRGERRQVAAGTWLAEQLAPHLACVEDRRQPARLLRLGSVGEEGRAGEVDANAVHQLRRSRARVLRVVER